MKYNREREGTREKVNAPKKFSQILKKSVALFRFCYLYYLEGQKSPKLHWEV